MVSGTPPAAASQTLEDVLADVRERLDAAQRRFLWAQGEMRKAECACRAALRGIEAVKAEIRVRDDLAAKLAVNPEYQAALLDAESESWDGPGIDGRVMIEAADERRRVARCNRCASPASCSEFGRCVLENGESAAAGGGGDA